MGFIFLSNRLVTSNEAMFGPRLHEMDLNLLMWDMNFYYIFLLIPCTLTFVMAGTKICPVVYIGDWCSMNHYPSFPCLHLARRS